MAGLKPGPVPKRDEDRIRRNKTSDDGMKTTKYDLDGEVKIPNAYFFNSYVNDIWLAIKESVNVKFFEPTDWAYAKFTLKMIDDQVGQEDKFKPLTANMVMALDAMLSKLMLTEADRRKLRIEANRDGKTTEEGKLINAQAYFQKRFEAQREA